MKLFKKYPNGSNLISRLYHSFLRHTSNSSIFSVVILTVLTLLFARPEALWARPFMGQAKNWLLVAAAIHVTIDALLIRKMHSAWLSAIFLTLLVIQSGVSIFAPAIYSGTPIQDFLLARDVSAYFQWSYASRLIVNFGLTFLVIATLPTLYGELGKNRRLILSRVLQFILVINVFVALLQGFHSIELFSVGSGSAISAGRSPALLEDSGASTVIFAAAISFFVGKCLIEPKISTVLGTFILAIAGYQTGGRTFFVSSFAGGFFAVFVYLVHFILRGDRLKSTGFVVVFSAIVGLMAALYMKIPSSVTSSMVGFCSEILSGKNIFESIADQLWSVDPVRATSLRVMILAAKARYWDGAGFGTYHSYYREYFPDVERVWSQGYNYLDLPSALYAAIPAELGVLNGYFILAFVSLWGIFRCKILFSRPMIPVAAALFSIFCSSWFGLHFLFQSFAIAIGLLIAAVEYFASKSTSQWPLKVMASIILMGLVLSILIKIQIAPRQVSFRSEVLNGPQLPVGINAPISSRGRKGLWLASGAEVFYPGHPIEAFIELPAERYPIHVNWIIRGPDSKKLDEGKVVIDKLDSEKGGIDLKVGGFYGSICSEKFNRVNHCSVQVETKPTWKWGRHRLGWFNVESQ